MNYNLFLQEKSISKIEKYFLECDNIFENFIYDNEIITVFDIFFNNNNFNEEEKYNLIKKIILKKKIKLNKQNIIILKELKNNIRSIDSINHKTVFFLDLLKNNVIDINSSHIITQHVRNIGKDIYNKKEYQSIKDHLLESIEDNFIANNFYGYVLSLENEDADLIIKNMKHIKKNIKNLSVNKIDKYFYDYIELCNINNNYIFIENCLQHMSTHKDNYILNTLNINTRSKPIFNNIINDDVYSFEKNINNLTPYFNYDLTKMVLDLINYHSIDFESRLKFFLILKKYIDLSQHNHSVFEIFKYNDISILEKNEIFFEYDDKNISYLFANSNYSNIVYLIENYFGINEKIVIDLIKNEHIAIIKKYEKQIDNLNIYHKPLLSYNKKFTNPEILNFFVNKGVDPYLMNENNNSYMDSFLNRSLTSINTGKIFEKIFILVKENKIKNDKDIIKNNLYIINYLNEKTIKLLIKNNIKLYDDEFHIMNELVSYRNMKLIKYLYKNENEFKLIDKINSDFLNDIINNIKYYKNKNKFNIKDIDFIYTNYENYDNKYSFFNNKRCMASYLLESANKEVVEYVIDKMNKENKKILISTTDIDKIGIDLLCQLINEDKIIYDNEIINTHLIFKIIDEQRDSNNTLKKIINIDHLPNERLFGKNNSENLIETLLRKNLLYHYESLKMNEEIKNSNTIKVRKKL